MSQLQISRPQAIKGKKYHCMFIPAKNDWMHIAIKPSQQSIGEECKDPSKFEYRIYYEEGDSVNEALITALMMEIRALVTHKACIDTLCYTKNNVRQKLHWVNVPQIHDIRKMDVKSEFSRPTDMYAGNCFYSADEAKAFYWELKALFAKYGITVNDIQEKGNNNQ